MPPTYHGYTGTKPKADLDSLWGYVTGASALPPGLAVADLATFLRNQTHVFNVLNYGVGVGTGDDDSDAIQLAVDAACVAGGTVLFPTPKRYSISRTIEVRSRFPVNLVADMGTVSNEMATQGAFIRPLNDIAGPMIRYRTPTAARGDAGGGSVYGLGFQDDSNTGAATYKAKRTYSVTACLELKDFTLGTVEGCQFETIKGSAIRTDYCIQSAIRHCQVHHCGDVGRPAFDISSTDDTYITQALSIVDNRIEVCYDEPYIKIDARSKSVKVTLNGFEADNDVELTSCQTFVHDLGILNFIGGGNHFNRTTEVAVICRGATPVVGNTFSGNSGGSLQLAGDLGIATGNAFFDNNSLTVPTVELVGLCNMFVGNRLDYSGHILASGAGSKVDNNHIFNCVRAGGYAIELEASTSSACNNTIYALVASTTTGGIRASTGPHTISLNTIVNWLVGLDIQTSTCVVTGNVLVCTTNITGTAGFLHANTIRGNTGYVTENNGQAAVAAGNTSVTFNHGLSGTPELQDIMVTPGTNIGSATKWWISSISATQLILSVDVAPGGAGAVFAWSVAII